MTVKTIIKEIQRLASDCRGAAAVELALIAPVLVALMLSGVEISRFILLNQKIERVSVTMADLTSQAESLTEADLDGLFQVSGHVMAPFDLMTDGQVIISSINAKDGNPAVISWQRSFGVLANASGFGGEGGAPTFTGGFSVNDNESLIVAEVYYTYEPLVISGVIDPVTLYNASYFQPRIGSLDTLN